MDPHEFMIKGIDLHGKVVVDAGTGAANTTLWLARKLKKDGGKRLISVDSDPETFADAKKKLGGLAGIAEFVQSDLTNLPQIRTGSVDVIVCHATMCALSDRPLKALRALSEFYRVLRNGGWLAIDDECPLPVASRQEEKVQVMRWQTYKACAELVDGEHYTEIFPADLEFAAKLVGFRDAELKEFDGGSLTDGVMEEWREMMSDVIRRIEDNDLRVAFGRASKKIWNAYQKCGGVFPSHYVLRMRKPS